MDFEKLKLSDTLDYLNLLDQLSPIMNDDVLEKFINFYKKLNTNHMIYVLKLNNQLIGCGTLLIENKVIHNFSQVAHIEDIVVNDKHRGCGYGKLLVQYLIDTAKLLNCYKISLMCSDENVGFYQRCGLYKKNNEMALYF